MDLMDILNCSERAACPPAAARWQEIREFGNQITHEYRLDPAELAATSAVAFGKIAEMSAAVAALKNPRSGSL